MENLPTFFKIFRKKGFLISLKILYEYDTVPIIETEFLKQLEKNNSYFNDFYRSKTDLLKHGLIGYSLDEDFNKNIFLTPKGKNLLEKIQECDELLELKDL